MVKKIFRSILLASIAVLFAAMILIMGMLYRYFTQIQFEQLRTQTALAAQGVSQEGKTYFKHLKVNNIRITWVSSDGRVLYDTQSEAEDMENHKNREEIKKAILTGYGESTRYSSTLTQKALYSAQRLEDGTVIRLSMFQQTIFVLLLKIIPSIVGVFFVAVTISIVVAKYTSKRIILPLNTLNLEEPLTNDVYEELSPLLRYIDQHQRELKVKESLLSHQKKEFETITLKIKEGMLFLDGQGKIISVNPAARELFQMKESCIGQDILVISRNRAFNVILKEAFQGKKIEKNLFFDEVAYKMFIRPIFSENEVAGMVVLLLDITEQLQAEQMRREFTANVSHELKTPLHIISGYSEIIKNNLVSSTDIQKFSEKIYTESQRMVQLVEDIIKLSHLDEVDEILMEKIDLFNITKNVLDSLTSNAQKKSIALEILGDSSFILGNPVLVHSIIYNLCDNAIKYNKQKGTVFVTVIQQCTSVIVEIRDTGIGLNKEEVARIFERFYRVDKSRSKKVGGTGLGLSIVKHAVQLHHAKIDVESVIGSGTTVRVTFLAYASHE